MIDRLLSGYLNEMGVRFKICNMFPMVYIFMLYLKYSQRYISHLSINEATSVQCAS